MTLPDGSTPSSFVHVLGASMDELHDGYARMSIRIEEKHTNPNGVMHGGVAATLMDEAIGAAIMSVRGMEAMRAAPHATVEMNVSFLAGPRVGDELTVEARTLKVGRSVAFGEAEIKRLGRGDLIAKGRFTYVIQAERNA